MMEMKICKAVEFMSLMTLLLKQAKKYQWHSYSKCKTVWISQARKTERSLEIGDAK